ncbi:MAG: substrate-binding domain-containing protein [Tannerellaceae bacterium]|jgi:signal transduction histidine kinase/CheY-like chemotaxis protein|nr:substrate-binding domain-containing protein [Tannerellaceae bacterium]
MKTFVSLLLAGLTAAFFASCHQMTEEKKFVIGLSQCMLDDAWRMSMIRETLLEASNYDNIEMVIRNADSNNEQQISQIRELIDMRVDVLIISPNQSEPLTPIAVEAFQAGIPTIITDRKINSDLYTTFIGADNYEIGLTAGTYARPLLPENAVVLEIWGMSSSSPAQERHLGFAEAVKDRRDISFIHVYGDWRYDSTSVRIRRTELPRKIDFVYAHNDMMAIAAREYFDESEPGSSHTLPVIGVDAVPNAGLEAVADGRINASFMYPTGGEQVIRTAMQLLEGEAVKKYIRLESAQVDQASARTLLLQSKTIQRYQDHIEQQRSNIELLLNRFRFLQNSLFLISVLLVALIILIFYTFHINRKVYKRNGELSEMNRKEKEQQEKLLALNTQIKEVTAQKLQFFTNVSHELRTPLTLIIAPLNKLAMLMKDSPYLPDLLLIRKNADRLLRDINQILDFRKLESAKERLKVHAADIISLAGEVKTYFESMARSRNIELSFHAGMEKEMVWIDSDKIEKILVNLLSNAFKFTPDGGKIQVSLYEREDKVYIEVEDNGQGIEEDRIPYLFDRFYTGKSAWGTGIGLHLAKEYILLHHGNITVRSVAGKGAAFTVSLHKGKEHFEKDTVRELPASQLSFEASQLDDTKEKAALSAVYPYAILIVEDDREVLSFLEDELRSNFRTLTATNGKEALEILQAEEVSLLLSDVMMPGMNGFELCRIVKHDVSLNHIPVILLTALAEERQKTFALSGGADDYIQKPFGVNYVKLKIIRILEERKRFREQLLARLQSSHLLQTDPGKVENMDDLFLRKFIACIEEVYPDAGFNIEKLSDSLGLSRGHLHRKIKELTGTPPVDFLRNYRLRKAAILLLQEQLSVSEIAYQTGFSSPAYFSKRFKELFQMTPKAYQETHAG